MAKTKIDDQIAALQEKLTQLKVRQKNIETRKRTIESRRERKADTRRKILIGAVIMAKIEQGTLDTAQLKDWLSASLERSDDRALFGLPPLAGMVLVQRRNHADAVVAAADPGL